ncbi:MAG: hypothetical protein KF709_01660 [Gemmatimonadaceae bacterium]|nr:hypothetical protein [Gemmatimonadaceae bacterium]
MSARPSPRLYALLLAAGIVGAASCGPPPDAGVLRAWTDDFEFRIVADVTPPRALERITYTITVLEKESRAPVVNGEGQIFATNADRKTVYNGFTYGPEAGTYRATLTFVTAGDWAMGLRFRRDSTQVLQRTLDWRQAVRNEAPPGEDGAVITPPSVP